MIYLLVGVPASGKTWVCDRLKGAKIVRNDDYKERSRYLNALKDAHEESSIVIGEAPFRAAELASSLERSNIPVKQVLVTAPLTEIEKRYKERPEGLHYRPAFRTNHARYEADPDRFEFSGTSEQVLDWLKDKVS